ncbi:uncharacterized protein TRIADDRAFT_37807 [Trichoplax adhaerens]|uniref:rRNA methyltransferase 1, mitochondrial n=1 Tax=Trichoplax adhaerens TaxID=10228 RepID=B3S0S7_TRIAD|nr:hypothetical protein TRIADDRAFT_37807 [Trichoplax adhaerens]EDV23695.1 hypothetical protein TRIADDRAFT_37807 [Trichoplax adhaerens]|eukprot:XP_002113221.1 hypothetical protein TRIADDRAFT_37807 [Trichoplax adhaerens]
MKIDEDREIIYGIAPCQLALKADRRKIYHIYVRDPAGTLKPNKSIEHIIFKARKLGIHVLPSDKRYLDKLTEGRPHQGVAMKATPLRPNLIRHDLDKTAMANNRKALWLGLNDVQDPMNLGALIRTAALMGVNRVVVNSRKTARLSAVVSKASAGAMEVYPIYAVKNLSKYLDYLVENDWNIIGTVGHKEVNQYQAMSCQNFNHNGKPTILMLGNEGFGISASIKEKCNSFLTIPTSSSCPPDIDSLNVSVAAGILLYSLRGRLNRC